MRKSTCSTIALLLVVTIYAVINIWLQSDAADKAPLPSVTTAVIVSITPNHVDTSADVAMTATPTAGPDLYATLQAKEAELADLEAAIERGAIATEQEHIAKVQAQELRQAVAGAQAAMNEREFHAEQMRVAVMATETAVVTLGNGASSAASLWSQMFITA